MTRRNKRYKFLRVYRGLRKRTVVFRLTVKVNFSLAYSKALLPEMAILLSKRLLQNFAYICAMLQLVDSFQIEFAVFNLSIENCTPIHTQQIFSHSLLI